MIQANDLTDEQKQSLLAIGAPTGETAMIPVDVLNELVRIGLLYYRSPKSIDMTEEGENIYQELGGKVA